MWVRLAELCPGWKQTTAVLKIQVSEGNVLGSVEVWRDSSPKNDFSVIIYSPSLYDFLSFGTFKELYCSQVSSQEVGHKTDSKGAPCDVSVMWGTFPHLLLIFPWSCSVLWMDHWAEPESQMSQIHEEIIQDSFLQWCTEKSKWFVQKLDVATSIMNSTLLKIKLVFSHWCQKSLFISQKNLSVISS